MVRSSSAARPRRFRWWPRSLSFRATEVLSPVALNRSARGLPAAVGLVGGPQQSCCGFARYPHMDYKGISYQVVQTANPAGWKWTVSLPGKRTKTGECRVRAIATAQKTIDKALNLPDGQLDPLKTNLGRLNSE